MADVTLLAVLAWLVASEGQYLVTPVVLLDCSIDAMVADTLARAIAVSSLVQLLVAAQVLHSVSAVKDFDEASDAARNLADVSILQVHHVHELVGLILQALSEALNSSYVCRGESVKKLEALARVKLISSILWTVKSLVDEA